MRASELGHLGVEIVEQPFKNADRGALVVQAACAVGGSVGVNFGQFAPDGRIAQLHVAERLAAASDFGIEALDIRQLLIGIDLRAATNRRLKREITQRGGDLGELGFRGSELGL
jgi:hypothetical protein